MGINVRTGPQRVETDQQDSMAAADLDTVTSSNARTTAQSSESSGTRPPRPIEEDNVEHVQEMHEVPYGTDEKNGEAEPAIQEPVEEANWDIDDLMGSGCERCPAVYRLPKALTQVFQSLFTKNLTSLLQAQQGDGECELQTKAFMALPTLIYGVTGQREVRRAKRRLVDIEQAPNVNVAILQEAARLTALRQEERLEHDGRLPRRRIVELVEAGLPGKAVARLEGHLQGGIAELDEEAKREVRELHPFSDASFPVDDPVLDQVASVITAAEVAEALENAPRLSASGQSGWTYDLVREVLSSDASRVVAAELLSVMSKGSMKVKQVWLASRLVLIPKPTGGSDPLRWARRGRVY